MLLALFITFVAFAVMALLVGGATAGVAAEETLASQDIVMPDREIETRYQRKKPPKPEPVEISQPDISIPAPSETSPLSLQQVDLLRPEYGGSQPGFWAGQGEILPIVKVQPVYPRRAHRRICITGVHGYRVRCRGRYYCD
jgi:protein TonB